MKRILILLSVLGLLLGACGGGDDDNNSNASDDSTETTVADDGGSDSSDGDLKSKLLAVDDLPSGFKLTNSEERDPATENTDDEEDSEFCQELNSLEKEYSGEREAEATFERAKGDSGGVSFNQQISRYKSADEADDAFAAFEEGFGKCKTFTETDETDGTTLTGSFEKTDFEKAGDDTYASLLKMKQTGGGQSIELDGYLIALREGEHLVLLGSFGFGDELSKSELEGIAKKAVAKI